MWEIISFEHPQTKARGVVVFISDRGLGSAAQVLVRASRQSKWSSALARLGFFFFSIGNWFYRNQLQGDEQIVSTIRKFDAAAIDVTPTEDIEQYADAVNG